MIRKLFKKKIKQIKLSSLIAFVLKKQTYITYEHMDHLCSAIDKFYPDTLEHFNYLEYDVIVDQYPIIFKKDITPDFNNCIRRQLHSDYLFNSKYVNDEFEEDFEQLNKILTTFIFVKPPPEPFE